MVAHKHLAVFIGLLWLVALYAFWVRNAWQAAGTDGEIDRNKEVIRYSAEQEALIAASPMKVNRWPPLFDNIANKPVPATYERRSPAGLLVSIVLTVFNQEESIATVVEAILERGTGPFELITVFDGCTDNSPAKVKEVMDAYFQKKKKASSSTTATNKGCVKWRPTTLATSHYESKANNIGLRAAASEYALIIQDDMLMVQDDFDRILLRPMISYKDVLAVTGKCSHNIRWNDDRVHPQWIDQVGFCGHHHYDIALSETFTIRDTATRGPLMLHKPKLELLRYLDDEAFYPQESDDHDLCLRGYMQFGFVCGHFPVSVHGNYEWSHRRKDIDKRPQVLREAEQKNNALLLQRHATYLRDGAKHDQNRHVHLTDL